MKLTITRSEWYRGQVNSMLLKSDGKKCCLGFYALALGATEDQIRGQFCPNDVATEVAWPSGFVIPPLNTSIGGHVTTRYSNSGNACDLIFINDHSTLTEKDREAQLTEEFAKIGVEVEFVD